VNNKPRAKKSAKRALTRTPKSRESRRGMPKDESIVSTAELTSPITGRRYRILHTTEMDPYDKPTTSKKKIR
jgi:hypothetical protein